MSLHNEASGSKFVTRKWKIINDQSSANYNAGNTVVLKSNLYDYSSVYILVKGDVIIGDIRTQVALKSCAPFNRKIETPKLIEKQ